MVRCSCPLAKNDCMRYCYLCIFVHLLLEISNGSKKTQRRVFCCQHNPTGTSMTKDITRHLNPDGQLGAVHIDASLPIAGTHIWRPCSLIESSKSINFLSELYSLFRVLTSAGHSLQFQGYPCNRWGRSSYSLMELLGTFHN